MADIIIMFCNFIFVYSLVRMIITLIKNKEHAKSINPASCFLTGTGIFIIGICMFTFSANFSGSISLVSGSLWFVYGGLAIYFKNKRR